jgi:very-short-patch-repair endonuclease
MYFGAKPDIFKKAKELRKMETKAEKTLWYRLNKNQLLGLSFRRQHPINQFIADFFCPKINLVVEVDGGIHDLPENKVYDIGRSEILNTYGIQVIRFSNDEVITNTNSVIETIKNIAKTILVRSSKVPQLGDLGGNLRDLGGKIEPKSPTLSDLANQNLNI